MTHDLPMLTDLLVIIACSLPVLFVFRRIGLPPVAGFVVTGIIIGPYGLGLVSSIENVEIAAEVGVVLLLFMVGLELSLSGLLKTPWRMYVIAIGQVVITSAVGFFAATMLGVNMGAAVVIGFVVAVSSSAIVLKGLADKGELTSPLGRSVVTICVVQDFAIVPMMVIVGILSVGYADPVTIGNQVGGIVLLIGVLYLFARYLLPALMRWMVGIRTPEVFLLFTILVLFGTAWATSLTGLSLALGAFAAGLILSENEYSAQILSELTPFQSLFSSLFFVSVGMLLNVGFVVTHLGPVLAVAVGVLIVKMLVVLLIGLPLGVSLREGVQGGFYLAQIGEFSFLLMTVALSSSLLAPHEFQYLIAASSLTLAITPLIMQAAPQIAWHAHSRLRGKSPEIIEQAAEVSRPKPAVLIVGYGLNGHNVARVLREAQIYYEILDFNPQMVRTARAHGEKIHYGDATRSEILKQLRFREFDSAVIAISEAEATRRAVSILHRIHPDAHIIARTRYVAEVEQLERLGADVVVPEEFETSLRIFADLLAHYHIPPHIIAVQMDLVRRQSYGMLRRDTEPGDGGDDLQRLLLQRLVEAVPILDNCPAVGKRLSDFGFTGESRCRIISVIRGNCPLPGPLEDVTIEVNDMVVLYSDHAGLNDALKKFA